MAIRVRFRMEDGAEYCTPWYENKFADAIKGVGRVVSRSLIGSTASLDESDDPAIKVVRPTTVVDLMQKWVRGSSAALTVAIATQDALGTTRNPENARKIYDVMLEVAKDQPYVCGFLAYAVIAAEMGLFAPIEVAMNLTVATVDPALFGDRVRALNEDVERAHLGKGHARPIKQEPESTRNTLLTKPLTPEEEQLDRELEELYRKSKDSLRDLLDGESGDGKGTGDPGSV